MAALIVQSPTNLAWLNVISKPSAGEDRSKPTRVRYPKRLRDFPAMALSLSQNSDSIFDGSCARPRVAYEVASFNFNHYSESVVKKVYPNCEAVPFKLFDDVFDAVERGVADVAVLPIERTIHTICDPLLDHSLHIVGEAKVTVEGLTQCEYILKTRGLDDPVGIAKELFQKLLSHKKTKDPAVLATLIDEFTLYTESVRNRHRHETQDNVTPYLMLAREPIIPGIDRPFKTSIVFSPECCLEAFCMALELAPFKLRQIKFNRIQSLYGSPDWLLRATNDNENEINPTGVDNIFYVDLEASVADYNVQAALSEVKEFARFLRVLGSYNVDTIMI